MTRPSLQTRASPTAAARPGPAVRVVLAGVRLYRYALSPLLGPRCRHLPTCAEYAEEAVGRHGLWRGGRLAAWRLARCHPLGTSGYDPVPD